MKHKPFITCYGGCSCELVINNIGEALLVNQAIVITKEEVMRFFNLVDAPEPKKPVHADLIKAFAEGAVIEYRHADSMPANKWWTLTGDGDDHDRYAVAVFMSISNDPYWSFRIKPE